MKKSIFYVLMFCAFGLMACSGGDEPVGEKAFVDLGLPSGTLWCNQNEVNANDPAGYYNYSQATSAFNDIPYPQHWQELFEECTRTWTGKGYKLVGPNGNSIFLPAAGYREWTGTKYTDCGFYWAYGTVGTGYAYGVYFTQSSVETEASIFKKYLKEWGGSVRLVQKK